MKKIGNILGFFVLIAVMFSACKSEVAPTPEPIEPKPTADFTIEQSGGEEDPFTYTFNNKSVDFKEIRWEFGDDSSSLEVSPVHTFLKTGTFKVKLRTLNSQGYWAQKESVIEILPDDIIEVNATPVGDGSLDLSLQTSANIDSLFWYKGLGTNAELIEAGPTTNITVQEGQFENYTLRVQTPNGSKVEIERLLTDIGVVKDITNNARLVASRSKNDNPEDGEGSLKLIDNNINTKALLFDYTSENAWWRLDYFNPVIISAYTLTSANDAPERDPKDWVIQGSNDGETWATLDSRSGELFTTIVDGEPAYKRFLS